MHMFGILSPVMTLYKEKIVQVKRSKAGLGLYAGQDIKKGAFVIEYMGEKISPDEADRRGGKYLFTVNKKVVIDGKGRDNTARYINHSCRPNCEAEVDEEKERVRIFARKNIEKGAELNYDYGKEYWNDYIKPFGCRCDKCTQRKRRTKGGKK